MDGLHLTMLDATKGKVIGSCSSAQLDLMTSWVPSLCVSSDFWVLKVYFRMLDCLPRLFSSLGFLLDFIWMVWLWLFSLVLVFLVFMISSQVLLLLSRLALLGSVVLSVVLGGGWWHGAIFMVQTLINAVPLFGTSEFMLWEKVLKSVKKWTFWKSKFSELSWNIRPIWRWSYIPLVMLLPNKPKKDKLNLSWTHINFPLFLFLEWNWKE